MVNTCFKQKGNLIKCLIFLVSILIVILVALAITLVRKKEEKTCNSENCIQMSAEVIRYVDKSQDACEDFHAFSCGRYAKNRREFPPAEPEDELDSIIYEPVLLNDTKPLIMAKLFYRSCSNLGGIDMDNDETILNIFYSMGEWPVLKGANWSGTYFDWTQVATKSRNLGLKIDWFFDFVVFRDTNDTRTNILKIQVPKSLQPMQTNEMSLKKKLFTEVALIMGGPKYLAHYETAKTIEFEDSLGIIAERQRGRETVQNYDILPKLTINEIQVIWPSIGWLDLINNITGNRMIGSDWVIFNVLEYVEELNKLIYGTPKRIVADYMLWKIVEEIWPFLSQPVREKFEQFNHKVYNLEADNNRQKFCVNESKKLFPLVMESVYIRRHVTEQKRQLVREMLVIIQNKFIKAIHDSTSLKREARQRALARLYEIRFMVGGPDEVFDEFGFAENLGLYGFSFNSNNIIDMLTTRKIRYYEKYYSVLNRAIANNTLDYYQKIVNITSFIVVKNNTIIIPSAILRDSFYNPNLPNYFNFGTLGERLAREIFNLVFFTQEEDVDYERELVDDIFDHATKCLIKESSHFLHNFELRKPRRMRDYLANFVAVDIAYQAYKEWLLIHPEEFSTTVENFTPGQLFWIHTSKSSCNKIYKKHDKDISRFKIIAPLRNSQNFAKEYQCRQGTKMNPHKRCNIL